MAQIAATELTHTFDAWRLRTNQLATRLNQFAVNEAALYANTVTANTMLRSSSRTNLLGSFANVATVNTNFVGGRVLATANLVVSGISTFNKNLQVNKNAALAANLAHSGANANFTGGRLLVSANSVLSGTLTLNKNLQANKNLTVAGNTVVSGVSTFDKNATFNKNLAVSANASFSGNVSVTGTGDVLLRTANVDVRGGTMLVTSNVVATGTVSGPRVMNRARVLAAILSMT